MKVLIVRWTLSHTHTHTQLTLIITLFLSTNQYQQVLINNNVRIHIYIKKLDCKPLKERGLCQFLLNWNLANVRTFVSNILYNLELQVL